ncbi:MAG TPA: DNA-directed RNA polymerase subunit beta', partial [Nocardioidaceae bacterium]|nr:DNA-directed RNA polymerase subunit beta' [Nocardioidaceae bacterium]
RYHDKVMRRVDLKALVDTCYRQLGGEETAHLVDGIKDVGFEFATRGGMTIGLFDIEIPKDKQERLDAADESVLAIDKQFQRGLITEDERYEQVVGIWQDTTGKMSDEMMKSLDPTGPVTMMTASGARGNKGNIGQLGAMRGLMADPSGRIIDVPVRSNFREGMTVLEYFISTHGARKGLADTALRTADSGYLTRRLVDVAQDVITREDDCGTEEGSWIIRSESSDEAGAFQRRLVGRLAAAALPDARVKVKKGETAPTLVERLEIITEELAATIDEAGIDEVLVRSPLTCEARYGVCRACYGRNLATGEMVGSGEAVGIIAAQSIGEPGTQLTMRTFHTGGVAGDDITHGLPRVVELFEARTPKGRAPISEVAGRVRIDETDKTRKVVIIPDDGSDEHAHPVTKRARLRVADDDTVDVGQQLTHGTPEPQDVLRILGVRAAQQHLVDEVQEVYRSQGVSIHDKHIEIIVRQMLRRITVIEQGDANLLTGDLVDRVRFEEENRRVVAEGGTPASGRPVLMGITKASLATESWLSAASFQETTRVLTDAAIHAKSDALMGLKENVIIGKLIPAGTGLERYRNIRVEPTEEARAAAYSMAGYESYEYDFGSPGTQSVALDDFGFGSYGGN